MNILKEHSDYADYMEKESESFEAAYHLFIQKVSNHSLNEDNAIPCFFEGKDDIAYYPSRIRKIIEYKNIHKKHLSIDCNGRKNVLRMLIKLTYEQNPLIINSLFFVDKDFYYENSMPDQIYVTPHNAIENFYASENTLDNFLENYSNISKYSVNLELSDYNIIKNYFNNELKQELESYSPLSAWYSLQTNFDHKGEQPEPRLGPISTLKNVKNILKKEEEYDEINLDFLKKYTLTPREVDEEELLREIELIEENLIVNTRGKYIEEILINLYQDIIKEAKLKKGKSLIGLNDVNIKSMHLDSNSFKSTLTVCADTPQCLNDYLIARIN